MALYSLSFSDSQCRIIAALNSINVNFSGGFIIKTQDSVALFEYPCVELDILTVVEYFNISDRRVVGSY